MKSTIAVFLGILLAVPASWAQCTKDTDCKGNRICVNGECVEPLTSTMPESSAPQQPASSQNMSAGWALPAAVAGFASIAPIMGLAIGAAANSEEPAISIPLGAAATGLLGAAVPIVAVGGKSAHTGGSGPSRLAFRIPGWIAYGLALADATTMIILGASDVTVPPAPIVITGVLGSSACALMSVDALVARKYALESRADSGDDRIRIAIVPSSKGCALIRDSA